MAGRALLAGYPRYDETITSQESHVPSHDASRVECKYLIKCLTHLVFRKVLKILRTAFANVYFEKVHFIFNSNSNCTYHGPTWTLGPRDMSFGFAILLRISCYNIYMIMSVTVILETTARKLPEYPVGSSQYRLSSKNPFYHHGFTETRAWIWNYIHNFCGM